MNIGDMNFHINNASTPLTNGAASTPVSDAGTNVTQSGVMSGNAAITQINEGQAFQGNVVNITGQEVQIMLEGDMMLTAHMSEAVNINIGDSLSFLVQENNGNNVTIRPLPTQDFSGNSIALQKALDANHLLPTEKNFQIAQSLMDHNMPLDKATMQQIMQQAIKYPDVSIDTLVHMNKVGITVNEASIEQFNSYMEGTHQLSNAISEFSDSIVDFSGSVLSDMLADTNVSSSDLMQFQGDLAQAIIGEDYSSIASGDKALEGMQTAEFEQSLQALAKAPVTEQGNLTEQVNQSLQNMIQAAKGDESTYDPTKLLAQVNNMLKDAAGDLPKDMLAAVLNSESYKTLLDEAIKQKFTLNKNSLQDAGEIDSLYKKIYDASNRLMDSFQDMGGKAGEQMRDQAGNMKQRLDFIQNLNEMYAYAQMPVKLQEDAFNSELYVYMNKKQQKAAKEAVSALLHLDMDHLGPTDVHVSLHDTVVHTKFYVEDPVSAKILDEHMNRLEQAVNEKGFSLSNEVVMREPSILSTGNAVVDEMMGSEMEKSVKRYTFDVRM